MKTGLLTAIANHLIGFYMILCKSLYLFWIREITSWTQDVHWMYIRRSKDVLDIFWTFYLGSIYVLCPGGIEHSTTYLYLFHGDPTRLAAFKIMDTRPKMNILKMFIRYTWTHKNNLFPFKLRWYPLGNWARLFQYLLKLIKKVYIIKVWHWWI